MDFEPLKTLDFTSIWPYWWAIIQITLWSRTAHNLAQEVVRVRSVSSRYALIALQRHHSEGELSTSQKELRFEPDVCLRPIYRV